MNKYALAVLGVLASSTALQAIVPVATATAVVSEQMGNFLNNDPYAAAQKKENQKGYWERLEERRNIPDTKEEWLALIAQTINYIHAYELKNPGTRAPAVDLERIINDGWKDGWFKRNPGWTDVMWIGGITGGIVGLTYLVIRSAR